MNYTGVYIVCGFAYILSLSPNFNITILMFGYRESFCVIKKLFKGTWCNRTFQKKSCHYRF